MRKQRSSNFKAETRQIDPFNGRCDNLSTLLSKSPLSCRLRLSPLGVEADIGLVLLWALQLVSLERRQRRREADAAVLADADADADVLADHHLELLPGRSVVLPGGQTCQKMFIRKRDSFL